MNLSKAFPILETERLILREVVPGDAACLLTYLSDIEVMKYFGMEPFQSEDDAIEEIQWYKEIFEENTGIRWGITLKEKDEVIGSCGFLNMSIKHSRAEIGAELSKDYWRKGIMSEALAAIIAYGFSHLNLMRIQALIEPPNIPSIKLFESSGFQREGLLRKYENTCGKFDDLYMYSLLRTD
ncbi:GNAT family protein [Bacillus sp. DTU_2020_1000418_1_SI_GHA_SEK_038]|uniref:GNAT family N-acetyltransferase n=1 Tax=Bacillus sp. DTU_2020_1000418_1_SI_GHA_SEK_038 TaxID=3077585 RepID=UPI0028E4E06E|nr:GNAT family protein [Bacillus sp. DTU_2020_1000418_1_SI_GHA_SEK_038]WNS75753.1 GNAT family protein [Bacillus sp. DTU_2020_1000418_1_SI_GHA_SEK_038]